MQRAVPGALHAPTAQHTAAPGELVTPGAQAKQAAAEVALRDGENLPASQGAQAEAPAML